MTGFTFSARSRRFAVVLLSSAALIALWGIASLFVSDIILPSPRRVIGEFAAFLSRPQFYLALQATVRRGIEGFLLSLLIGGVLGIAAGGIPAVEDLFRPLLSVVKATPVMSIILLAFIWFRSGTVPVFAGFLMAFPVVTQNVMIGVREVPNQLLEMARIYRFSFRQRFFHIILPSITPFLLSGARSALGLTWKVVVAAEVLTVPRHGIGSSMQFAQINLDTTQVLAWTLAAILLSAASELLFDLLAGLLQPYKRRRRLHAHSGAV